VICGDAAPRRLRLNTCILRPLMLRIKLNDPAIEDNNILISFDDLRKSASAIWGFAADAA